MEILERVRALTLAGQQRAAAGEPSRCTAGRCSAACLVPDAFEHAQALWTRRRATSGADRALPSNTRCLWRHTVHEHVSLPLTSFSCPSHCIDVKPALADLAAVVQLQRLELTAYWEHLLASDLHTAGSASVQVKRVLQPPPAHGHGAAATELANMSALSGGGPQQHGGAGKQVRGSGCCRHHLWCHSATSARDCRCATWESTGFWLSAAVYLQIIAAQSSCLQ